VTDPSARKPLITVDEFEKQTRAEMWFGVWLGARLDAIDFGSARVRLDIRPEFLREGGSVSGPIVMAVADIAMYAAVMSAYEAGHRSVTSDMTLHFLRRPVGDVLWADARVVKFGRRIAMGRIEVFADRASPPVAHVVASYAIPGTGK
jgi:uncharacterized protein (TIGR00369 family)